MLDLLGIEYINAYVGGVFHRERHTDEILAYIADTVNLIPQNKYRAGKTLSEILFDTREESGKSGDEIAEAIIKKHKLKVIEE